MNNLKENLDNVATRIRKACEAAGRPADVVRLLAVSKRHPAARIRELHGLGQRAFGENIVQEALEKQQALEDLDLEWHFIGTIQSNKTREIAEHFDWVQSVDRLKILKRLAAQRPADMAPLNVCLQVNIDGEAQKGGCRPSEAMELAGIAAQMPRIRLRGLMAIPQIQPGAGGASRNSFERMRALYDQCAAAGHEIDTLSIGMSADMEQAIEAGSTMVRVGTDIFGARPAQQNE